MTRRAALQELNSVYDARARPTLLRIARHVSMTSMAALTQSLTRVARRRFRVNDAFEDSFGDVSDTLEPSSWRSCGRMNTLPMNMCTRQYSSFRCNLPRDAFVKAACSLQAISSGRESHQFSRPRCRSTNRARRSFISAFGEVLRRVLQLLLAKKGLEK